MEKVFLKRYGDCKRKNFGTVCPSRTTLHPPSSLDPAAITASASDRAQSPSPSPDEPGSAVQHTPTTILLLLLLPTTVGHTVHGDGERGERERDGLPISPPPQKCNSLRLRRERETSEAEGGMHFREEEEEEESERGSLSLSLLHP